MMTDAARVEFVFSSGEEIVDFHFHTRMSVIPRVGDFIHYWQDETPDSVGGEGLQRRNLIVTSVTHDLRYVPPLRASNYQPTYVQTVIVGVATTGRDFPGRC